MPNVLIVDDDIGYLNALTEGLIALGNGVIAATNSAEALKLIETSRIDVALLDMIMEGGGAISMLHELRRKGYEFPIVVITGRPQIADSPVFQHGLRDASAKIEKSATLSEINELIKSLLKT